MIGIEAYIREMKANGLSESSITYTRNILTKLDKFKPLNKITKSDIVKFFEEFEGEDSTRNLHINVIKKYFKLNKKEHCVDWLQERKIGETLTSDEILTVEDINKLIETTDSHFFKALIAFLYESGCRIGEAKSLKYGDFKDTTDGMICNIPSKKTNGGYRRIILPFSSQYIKNLKLYTYAKDRDKVFPFVYSYLRKGILDIAKSANIGKPVNPHAFRHAQATGMVKTGYNEMIIRRKLGWTPTSKVISRYISLNDEDVINATLENNGKRRPEPKHRIEMQEAKPLRLEEAANRLFELEDENQRLQEDLLVLKHESEEDIKGLLQKIEDMKLEQIAFFKMMREKDKGKLD